MQEENLYELLQVSENADPEIIQAAYRRLIFRYHPDRSTVPNAAEMTQRLNDAYAILSDPGRRSGYDRETRKRTSSSSSGTGRTGNHTSQNRPGPPPPPRPPPRPPTPPRPRASEPEGSLKTWKVLTVFYASVFLLAGIIIIIFGVLIGN